LAVKGEEFVVAEVLENGSCTLRNIVTAINVTYSCGDLLSMYQDGDLVALLSQIGRYPLTAALKQKLQRDLSTFREDLVIAAMRMLKYVKAVESRNIRLDEKHLTDMIADVAAENNDLDPSSWSRVYRYYRLWVASGKDIRALIPDYCNRGRHTLSSIPFVGTTMMMVIGQLYMVRNFSSIPDVHLEIQRRIEDQNKLRGPRSQLPIPSPATVAREIARIPKYEVALAQKGERQANIDFRTTGKGTRATRPLEVTQIDHTPSDTIVIDDEYFLPLGRLNLTGVLDNFSEGILSIGDEFCKESSSTVARAVRRAITPKVRLLQNFPEVKKPWDCCGVPETLLWDNAMHFHSNHLERAALQLGCDIRYGPKNMPYYRALIEQLLGFLNRSCLHSLPGTTFSNVLQRGDYDPVKNGVIRRSTLHRILMIWVVDFYMQHPVRGLDDIPACRWRNYFGPLPPPLPVDIGSLDTALGECASRTAFHYGIEIFHLYYNSERLGEVRKRFGTGKSKSVDVEINYDRGDIGYIYVLDPGNGKYFRVDAVNYSEYAKGLNLWQHRAIRKWKLKNLRDKTDMIGLAEAKERIRQLVQQDLLAYPHNTHKSSAQFMESFERELESSPSESSTASDRHKAVQEAPRDIPEKDLPALRTNFTPTDPDDEEEDKDDLD
jgi:putative transposase